MKSTSPTVSGIGASSCSTRRLAPTSGIGALTAKPPGAADAGPYDPSDAAGQSVPNGELRRDLDDGLVYVCDRRNNRIQVFRKDGSFVKEGVRLEDDDRRGIGVGHRVLERPATAFSVRGRRSGSKGVRPRPRHAGGRSRALAAAAAGRADSTVSAASRSIRRATSIPERTSRASACRSSSIDDQGNGIC